MHDGPSVYGFAVDSRIPLRFLRAGGGMQRLRVEEADDPGVPDAESLLGEWDLAGGGAGARAALYKVQRGYEYRTTDAGRFGIDIEAGRIEVPVGGDPLVREQRTYALPLILHLLARGDFSLHAAAVEVEGGAVILAAPSRHGKTTLAYAFHRLGYRLLSEDVVCWRPGTLEVLPGPALIRLRPDMFDAADADAVEVAARTDDRVWLGIDRERRGSSAPVPLRAIVFPRVGDAIGVSPVPRPAAIPDLWSLGFRLPTRESRSEQFKQLAALVAATPVWNFTRPLRRELLGPGVETLVARIRH